MTDLIPKPLIAIQGRPIVSYQFSHFETFGINKFIIATGYKSEQFEAYFRNHHQHLDIQLIDSGDVDIIKRIQDAQQLLSDPFILCYGDTLANVDLNCLATQHHNQKALVTVTSYPMRSLFGVLEMNSNGLVESFVEKPVLDKWINIGYMYITRAATQYITSHSDFVEFLQDLINRKQLYSFQHKGIHITINTLKELDDAKDNISYFTETLGTTHE